MLGAVLVKALYALPTWTRVADLIAEHPGLSDALCGAPSHWACYRFATKLRKERERIAGCLDALTASLREQYPDMGREVAFDIPAYGNDQKFLYNGGPSLGHSRCPSGIPLYGHHLAPKPLGLVRRTKPNSQSSSLYRTTLPSALNYPSPDLSTL